MKRYKASRYNLFIPAQQESYSHVVANTYSGTIIFADTELAILLRSFNSQSFQQLRKNDSSLHSYLLANGFVVEDDLDELARLRIKFERTKHIDRQLHLTIAPTERCNLACPYCYEHRAQGQSLSPARIRQLTKFVERRKQNLDSLGVTWYGGEPLLALETIVELSRYFLNIAQENHFAYRAGIITNGTLLTEEVLEKLIEYKVGHAQITLDGPAELHNLRRGYRTAPRASFDDILAALKRCQGRIGVNIRINVDKTNIHRYKELIDLLANEKILGPHSGNGVSLGLVKAWTKQVGVKEEKMLAIDEFQGWIDDLERYLLERQICQTRKVDFSPNTPCGAVSISNFLVTPSGGLKKCWIHVTGNKGLVGNLKTGLNLERADAVRWSAYNPCTNEECSACALLPVCAGGCPYEMMMYPEKKSAYCRYMSHHIESNLLAASARPKQPTPTQERSTE